MRLRSGRATRRSTEENMNNSADLLGAAQVGNGDFNVDGEVSSEEEIDSSADEEAEQPEERGQGDLRSLPDRPCTKCLITSCRRIGWCTFSFFMCLLIFLSVIAPAIIKIFPEIPKHIVYLNRFKIPINVNLSDPSSVELEFTRNFYHHVDDDIVVGIWHILPKSLGKEDIKDEDFETLLSSGPSIILYCHGNTGSRGVDHRVEMYKLLAGQDFHVVALDYRGFGDSTGSPTSENGVMTDVVSLYLWLREKAGITVPIYVWGHSLGTGIATKAVRFLTEQRGEYPRGLMLESPFTNIFDAALEHPFSVAFRMFWWFDDLFLEAMHNHGIYLQNDEHICHIEVPIIIFHAEDDFVVPYALGKKLFEESKKRPSHYPPVTFQSFDYGRGLLHKWICTAPELPDLIHKFIAETKQTVK